MLEEGCKAHRIGSELETYGGTWKLERIEYMFIFNVLPLCQPLPTSCSRLGFPMLQERPRRGVERSDRPELMRGFKDDGAGTPTRLSPSQSQLSLSPSSSCFFPPPRPRSPSPYAEQTTNSLSGEELEGPSTSPRAGTASQSTCGPNLLHGRRRGGRVTGDAQGTKCATTTGDFGFSWGVIGSNSPGSRHSSFHEMRRGMMESSRRSLLSSKGSVRVAVTTAMSYKAR